MCLCATKLRFWLQTDLGRENAATFYRQGRQFFLTLLTMVTRWSRSTSNFYALIGQNLTGEFMRKIYAESWILFTLTAEADRVLCQLVMFLTVFFHWNKQTMEVLPRFFNLAMSRGRASTNQTFFAGEVAFAFCHHAHALVTLYVQFLCSDWSKFDRWVHAENFCSILNLLYFDSWSWQSFVSTCNVLTVFFGWM